MPSTQRFHTSPVGQCMALAVPSASPRMYSASALSPVQFDACTSSGAVHRASKARMFFMKALSLLFFR